jgi:hypothetical protein
MKRHHPKKSRQTQTLLFTLVSSLVVSTPTYALFGVGDVVFDPTNVAQTTT